MKLRERHKEELQVNITPLIDVVFLLLIFFMVSTTFINESNIRLTLPTASNQKTKQEADSLEVAVDLYGKYFVNGQQLSDSRLETLKTAIAEAAGKNRDPSLVISADSGATHQSVVTILDAARQRGFKRITFATQIRKEKDGAP